MTHEQLKAGRLQTALTQVQAAARLGVSQPYLSQLEKGERPITAELARSAAALYRLPATALPIPESVAQRVPANLDALARQLAGLGYPGFAHLRHAKANPAAVLLEALVQADLEVRLAEALPWVVLTYPDVVLSISSASGKSFRQPMCLAWPCSNSRAHSRVRSRGQSRFPRHRMYRSSP